jgi:hypothetical protein
MFRKSAVLIVITALVISGVIIGAALNVHPANAQAATMKALIQSLVDQGKAFSINTRATNFDVDGTTNKISQLGDDFVCVTGTLNVMGKPMQTVCSTFDSMIVILE